LRKTGTFLFAIYKTEAGVLKDCPPALHSAMHTACEITTIRSNMESAGVPRGVNRIRGTVLKSKFLFHYFF